MTSKQDEIVYDFLFGLKNLNVYEIKPVSVNNTTDKNYDFKNYSSNSVSFNILGHAIATHPVLAIKVNDYYLLAHIHSESDIKYSELESLTYKVNKTEFAISGEYNWYFRNNSIINLYDLSIIAANDFEKIFDTTNSTYLNTKEWNKADLYDIYKQLLKVLNSGNYWLNQIIRTRRNNEIVYKSKLLYIGRKILPFLQKHYTNYLKNHGIFNDYENIVCEWSNYTEFKPNAASTLILNNVVKKIQAILKQEVIELITTVNQVFSLSVDYTKLTRDTLDYYINLLKLYIYQQNFKIYFQEVTSQKWLMTIEQVQDKMTYNQYRDFTILKPMVRYFKDIVNSTNDNVHFASLLK